MNIEIEKKYVIKKPDLCDMARQSGYNTIEITQIYLASATGITHRVRASVSAAGTRYYETKKVRIDKMSAYEDEREISEEEYLSLKEGIKAGTRPIKKVRHVFSYLGQTFEIDIYPEWHNTCIMETELKSRDTQVAMPEFIEIISDVTGMREYSNYSMAHAFPPESYL